MITTRNFTPAGRSHNRNRKIRASPFGCHHAGLKSVGMPTPERSAARALSASHHHRWSIPMTKSGILALAAILTAALATPATAQDVTYNSRNCAQYDSNGNCQIRGPRYQRQAYRDQASQDRAWRNSYNRRDNDSGFWPGDVAAGVVGGAVGTAAAIATAPIGGDAYARQNGFVCTPGTWFRGE